MESKKINLNTEVSFISVNNFRLNKIFDSECLVFSYNEMQALNQSIYFFVMTSNYLSADFSCKNTSSAADYVRTINGDESKKVEYIICNDSFIVMSRGTYGFECKNEVLKCSVAEINDAINITITRVVNKNEIDKVLQMHQNLTFEFKTYLYDKIIGTLKSDYLNVSVRTFYQAFKDTEFINISDKDYTKIHVDLYPCNDTEESYKFKRIYASDYIYKKIDAKQGNELYIEEKDILIRKKEKVENYLEIIEIEKIVHDLYSNFIAIGKIKYKFPENADKIKELYPEVYLNECVKKMNKTNQSDLEYIDEVPFINTEFLPGNKICYEKVVLDGYELGIKSENFMSSELIAPMFLGDESILRIGLNCSVYALIESNGLYNIVSYSLEKFVRYNNEVYVKLCYLDEIGFQDWSSNKYRFNHEKFKVFEFLIYKENIKPINVSMKEYNERLNSWKK